MAYIIAPRRSKSIRMKKKALINDGEESCLKIPPVATQWSGLPSAAVKADSKRHEASPSTFESFLDSFPNEIEENEKSILRKINEAWQRKDVDAMFQLIKENHFTDAAKKKVLYFWDVGHYYQESAKRNKPLTPLARFRIRERYRPPENICPNGRKKATLPKEATNVLRNWLDNSPRPYPTRETKAALAELTGLTTMQDGVQISLDYSSSASYSYPSGADKTKAILQWFTWPFNSLANILSVLFNFLLETAFKILLWVKWPFRFLENQTVAWYEIVAGVCSSLNQKIQKQFEDPIKIIEAVLEVIWMVVSPFIRAVIWLCEIIITVKRYIKLKTALVLETYPAVTGYITSCKMIGEYLSKLLALWPRNWMESIEYVGYAWVILYFSFAPMKFAMMDEREMIRLARHSD